MLEEQFPFFSNDVFSKRYNCLDFVIIVIKIGFTIIIRFVIQTRNPIVRNVLSKGVNQIQKKLTIDTQS